MAQTSGTPRTRAAAGQRTCGDCAGLYAITAEHTDPRWCPSCTTAHLARCDQCTRAFDRDGHSQLCPSCREQVALFDLTSAAGEPRGGGR